MHGVIINYCHHSRVLETSECEKASKLLVSASGSGHDIRRNIFENFNFISGLVADIDIESEKYRWMGSARIDFYVSKPCNKYHDMLVYDAFLHCCVLLYELSLH